MNIRSCCSFAMAVLLAATPTFAQPPPTTTSATTSAPVADQSPVLLVLNARSAKLEGSKLTLEGVSPGAVVFATRPSRNVLHVATPDIVELWKSGTFARNPPNAAISVFEKDGSNISDAVLVLARASLAGDTLAFDVAVVNGSIVGADGPASIFIDTIWFQGGEYIGRSKTSGGTSPAVGSRSDTSTLSGWSNPAPNRASRSQPQAGTAAPPSLAVPPPPSICGPPHFPPC